MIQTEKFCFLRISTIESQQAKLEGRTPKQLIDDQLHAIEDKFHISFKQNNIIREEGTAYDIEKIHKRAGFLKLLNILFSAKTTTIKDVFLKKDNNYCVEVYVWDYDRFIRNIERGILFQVLNDLFNVTIFSYKDGKTLKRNDETPSEKTARYIIVSMRAYAAEQYSYTISENIKKAIVKKETDVTLSTKGNVWGRKFIDTSGNKVILTHNETSELQNYISRRIKYFDRKKKKGYGRKLKEEIMFKYGIRISDAYISKRRRKIYGER